MHKVTAYFTSNKKPNYLTVFRSQTVYAVAGVGRADSRKGVVKGHWEAQNRVKTEYQNEWSLFCDAIYTILTQSNSNDIPKHN